MDEQNDNAKPLTGDDLDLISQHFLLCRRLPPSKKMPIALGCKQCGRSLGCVANEHAIVFGRFECQGNQWSKLVGSSVISEKKTALKCGNCGRVTYWRSKK